MFNGSEAAADPAANAADMPQEVELQYGTGQVSGKLLEDSICLGAAQPGSLHCARLGVVTALVAATRLSSDPFEQFAFDGVVGLGLVGLSMQKDFNFFGRLVEAGHLPEPCFSVYLSKQHGKSEIAFGGHNQELATSDFDWVPVADPESGLWQVDLRSVRIDNGPSLCDADECRAVLDTGTSMLGVPEAALTHLHRQLARVGVEPTSDCQRVPGPPMVFDIGGIELRLTAEDYSRPIPMAVKSKSGNMSNVCRASLLPVPKDVSQGAGAKEMFVFGEPILQKYYTKFDWQRQRIGFALARQNTEHGNTGQAISI
jgi:cathepsin D/plasmepsin I